MLPHQHRPEQLPRGGSLDAGLQRMGVSDLAGGGGGGSSSVVQTAWERRERCQRLDCARSRREHLSGKKGQERKVWTEEETHPPGPYTDILPPGLCEGPLELIRPEHIGIGFKSRSNSPGCQTKLPRNTPAWGGPMALSPLHQHSREGSGGQELSPNTHKAP